MSAAHTLAVHDAVSTCKVCGNATALYGVADFNKTCAEHWGRYFPLLGVPIYYHQCSHCGLVFTRAFDHWSNDQFREHIYNDDYVLVDPDYVDERPRALAGVMQDFVRQAPPLALLDYGGGNGKMATLLAEQGLNAQSWDPVANEGHDLPPLAAFDLVSAFEVMEHTPDPLKTAGEALGFLRENGALLFSTLTIDHLPPQAIHFWYIAPRNGHISIHTNRSLEIMFGTFGYRVHHFSNLYHLALKQAPDWLMARLDAHP
ncbi:class I SAM-dependent methyltransferase [Paraburkholderia hayleyella]|uniref:class I SAM-dependent methyltransferase n=1 Tax=Paraburkholderia hayleyella TaxID=2152889 RepID=UPI0012921A01|nr:class I SAM-dependent methyltransferase [Paraburkholderia hayleyella]